MISDVTDGISRHISRAGEMSMNPCIEITALCIVLITLLSAYAGLLAVTADAPDLISAHVAKVHLGFLVPRRR